jgi:hypothetical protein
MLLRIVNRVLCGVLALAQSLVTNQLRVHRIHSDVKSNASSSLPWHQLILEGMHQQGLGLLSCATSSTHHVPGMRSRMVPGSARVDMFPKAF